jgi:uncharacterized protein
VGTAAVARDRDPLSFLGGVAEKLGWYVYALRDPRDGGIFYVGKGKGQRVYHHARHAKKVAGESAPQLKLSTIRDIHAASLEVGVEIVRHQIETEEIAYEVEAAVIDAMALLGANLTNVVGGHGTSRGWRPLEAIVAEYVAKPVEIEHPVVLIRITSLYEHGMTAEALYKATREWWRMTPSRHNPKWAFAVYNGIVRAVYRIERWEQEQPGDRKPRWAFDGVRDQEMEERYLWTDVTRDLPRGARNPIKYVNC